MATCMFPPIGDCALLGKCSAAFLRGSTRKSYCLWLTIRWDGMDRTTPTKSRLVCRRFAWRPCLRIILTPGSLRLIRPLSDTLRLGTVEIWLVGGQAHLFVFIPNRTSSDQPFPPAEWRRGDSNPHPPCGGADFKSAVSAYSTTAP